MNKEIQSSNNEANSGASEWDILSEDLQKEIAETVEDVAIEEETKAKEAEKAKTETSELIKEVIKLRGADSVKDGKWDNDLKAHVDANGMPTDYAHLMRYVQQNPDAIKTLTAERDDRLSKIEASDEDKAAYARWQDENMVSNAENLFPDDPLAREIASTNSFLKNETRDQFVNRIRRAAEAQRIADSGPSRMETGESQAAYNKRIAEATDAAMKREDIISNFDQNRPLWPQLNDEQRKELKGAYPRNDDETIQDWQARVEQELGVPVWMGKKTEGSKDSSDASKGTEAPRGPETPKGPDGPDGPEAPKDPETPKGQDGDKNPEDQPTDSDETDDDGNKAGEAATTEKDKAKSDYFPRPIAFASNEWYYMNRKQRREAAEKARAEAAAGAEAPKSTESEPAGAGAEEAAEAPKAEEEPLNIEQSADIDESNLDEKTKAALDFLKSLDEKDKILFLSGNGDLLSSESEDVIELYAKPLAEAGIVSIAKEPLSKDALEKQWPQYTAYFVKSFLERKKDDQEEEKSVELSEEAQEIKSKLESLHDLKSKLVFAQAKLEAKKQQLKDLPKGGLFDGKARKARKEVTEQIEQLEAFIRETTEQLEQSEAQFHAEMRNSTISAEERAQIQRDEEEMRQYGSFGKELAGLGPLQKHATLDQTIAGRKKHLDTIAQNYNTYHGKGAGAYSVYGLINAKADYNEVLALKKMQGENGFASFLTKEDMEGKADNPREVYLKSISDINAFKNESNAKLESLPDDQKEAYKEERRDKMRELATKVAEASRGFCREFASQCSSQELGDAWNQEIAAADVPSMFYAYRKIAEIVPGIKAESINAAKRVYDTVTEPAHRKFIEDKLKQYFGASDSFIAQLRGTDGEQQQNAA